ncbi:hypothetical protein BH11MYX4_BH11MYX4_05520 [soil metagenome]
MYREVDWFEAILFGIGGDTARVMECKILQCVRHRSRFSKNLRGGSAGRIAGPATDHAIYLAIFLPNAR